MKATKSKAAKAAPKAAKVAKAPSKPAAKATSKPAAKARPVPVVAAIEKPIARGGARPGSGRPKATGAGLTTRHQVSLDAATVDALRRAGRGNLSEGIRMAAFIAFSVSR